MTADGADMCLLEYEVVDAKERRCPLANDLVHFTVEGPAEWIGGIAYRDSVRSSEEWEKNPNCIRSLSLPVECGVNRALIRSTGEEGTISITAKSESGMTAAIKLDAIKSQAPISGENISYDKKSTDRSGNSIAKKVFVR